MSIVIGSPLDRGMELLRKTERELRTLLAQAVEKADYDEVDKITTCARNLKKLVEELAPPPKEQKFDDKPRARAEGYPKFFRDGTKLVMVGWSKKGSKEYTHIAPRIALDLLVRKLVEARKTRDAIPAHELLPLSDPHTSEEFPEYFVRTSLRWLRIIGVIKKYGHRGYSIRNEADYQSIIESRWNMLAARN